MTPALHPVAGFPDVVAPALPPAAPPGWRTGPPDFVGVGTMRSGTSWWWSLLAEHPGVAHVAGRPKEVHFFDRYGSVAEPDGESYYRYFPRPPGAIAGEWTPRYLYDYWTPPMLRRLAPQAKLLILLRDPVERYLSGLAHNHAHGFPVSQMLLHHQLGRSLYGQQIRTLLAHFPTEQILVLQYEQCARDPAPHLDRTLRFIGLDPAGRAAAPPRTVPVNTSRSAKPVLDPPTRRALAAALRGDAELVFERFPSLEPVLWPTMRDGAP